MAVFLNHFLLYAQRTCLDDSKLRFSKKFEIFPAYTVCAKSYRRQGCPIGLLIVHHYECFILKVLRKNTFYVVCKNVDANKNVHF